MRKLIYLAIVAAVSAIFVGCDKDDDYEFYTWEYSFEVTEDGGMSEEDLHELQAAFAVSAPELTFYASEREAETLFQSVIANFRIQFDPIIGSIQHTSDIVITIRCSSPVGAFEDVIVVK